MYQLGLVSISFRSHCVKELLKACQSTGLTQIEWGSDVHAPCRDTERLLELAKLQKTYGITCSSYGTYFRLGRDSVSELPEYIRAAKILGTNILRLWCGTKGSGQYTAEELSAFYEECRAAARIAEQEDVILCMECHNDTLTDWKEPALKLMQEVNSLAFRMYWQPNQHRTVEENFAYAELLAPYTEHIHVFNWEGDNRYPLGDAVSLWKEYLKRFDGDKSLLLEFMPDDNIETLPAEVNALRQIAEM